jgi:hypothetical protein
MRSIKECEKRESGTRRTACRLLLGSVRIARRLRLPRRPGNDGKVRIPVDLTEIQYKPLPARSPGGHRSGLQTVHFAEYLGVLGGEALGATRRERDGAASSSARRRTNGDTKVHGSVGGLWVKDGHKVLRSSHHPEDLMLASPAWFPKAASVLRGEGRLLAAEWS